MMCSRDETGMQQPCPFACMLRRVVDLLVGEGTPNRAVREGHRGTPFG
jgi:hypothetical protein